MTYKIDAYNDVAPQYADFVAKREALAENDSAITSFLDVVGDVSSLTVLDAGCGEGYLSHILAQRGAIVTGIDIAPNMVELARAKDSDGKITYQVADLCQPLPEYQQHFDLVASFFVLNDVYDYRGFLTTLANALKIGGRAVFFLNNPYSLVVRGHLTEYFADSGKAFSYRGMAEAGVKVHFYHRTLQEYLDAATSAGFVLERLVDVPTPEGTFKRRPDTLIPVGYHFPFFMILSFVKI